MSRLVDADKLRQRLNPDDWGTPDERWRPEREFGEFIDSAPTVDLWHYPSKGEYPTESGKYLVAVISWKETGEMFVDTDVDRWNGFSWRYFEPIAWMPLPDLPKEEA